VWPVARSPFEIVLSVEERAELERRVACYTLDLKRQMSGLATAGVFSEDLKRQMSAVAKSGILSEDLKRQMSGPAKLGVLSEDLRRQMDALAKPLLFSEEMRLKIEGLAMSLDPSGGTGRIIREAAASLSRMKFAAASLEVPAGRVVAEAASPSVRQIVDGDSNSKVPLACVKKLRHFVGLDLALGAAV
jgi:hypothetical protein